MDSEAPHWPCCQCSGNSHLSHMGEGGNRRTKSTFIAVQVHIDSELHKGETSLPHAKLNALDGWVCCAQAFQPNTLRHQQLQLNCARTCALGRTDVQSNAA